MRLFLFICFCFFLLTAKAQEKHSNSISVSLDARKMDFFLGLSYHTAIQKFDISAGIEAGLVKTIFQQRLFSGIQAQISYPLLKRERFSLGPALDVNFDLLRIQQASNHPTIFQEYRLGYLLKYGTKVKFFHAAGLGLISEHFYGAYSHQYLNAMDLGYSIKIGCIYDL